VTDPKPAAFVRLTDAALDDLDRLAASVPQALRWALKKMLLLEESPDAGEPLLGNLIGWRKLTVGDRDCLIVWRHTTDETASPVIEIAEVWAVGARSDKEVYLEMAARVRSLPATPHAVDLAEVIERFGKLRAGITAAAPPTGERLPDWLVNQLVHTAGMQQAVVDAMTLQQAVDAWTDWTTRPR
jgi:mRNA interferase RelE/StbE